MTTSITTSTRTQRAVPRTAFHAAWVLPVLVLGEFTLLGAIPVVLIAVGTIRRVSDRTLRGLAGLITLAYLAPLIAWILNPDRAESLSKDISPVFTVLIIVSSIAFLVRAVRVRTR